MLIALAVGLLLGVASQLLWPVLPSLSLLCGSLILLPACLPRASPRWRAVALLASGVAFGALLAAVHAGAVLDARLPVAREGDDFLIDFRILAVSQKADGGQMLQVSVNELPWLHRQSLLPMPDWRLRISTRVAIAAQPGERWQLPVRLRRPRASSNPGVADFERYLLGERVVATGYLREDGALSRLAPATGWMRLRGIFLAHTLPLLGDGPGDIADNDAERFARAVLPALVLDERSLLSSAQWQVLSDTGTAHLVAISGLHVALLWGALIWLGGKLLRRRSDTLKYRAAAVLPATALATCYAALAGMPLPAARATLMLLVASVFLVLTARVPAWRVLLASSAVVLLADPLAAHASGFWLSFGAVALLLLLNDVRHRAVSNSLPPALLAALAATRMQMALSILIAPMLIGLFGAASVSSVLANLPAIPLVNMLALPPALLGIALSPVAPGIANLLLDLATTTLAWLWQFLAWIDGFAMLEPLQAQGAGPLQIVAVGLLLPLLLFAASMRLRAALLITAVLAWPLPDALPVGTARVCVLDVGQGLAVLVRTAAHAVLYDTGPAWGERDAGATVVVPAARALGVRRLDLLVVSHDDNDHAGGAVSVQAALRPRAVLIGDPRSRERLSGEPCAGVRRWHFDAVLFTLFPGASGGNSNDRSCVLHIAAGRHAVLIPGDSTRRRELALVADYGAQLAATVLIAGHHGSRSSTSPTFLYRVAPQQVIFSSGYRNRFGHPHAEVTARVARYGASMHDTSWSGAMCFQLADTPSLPLWHARAAQRRFWRE